MKTEEVLATLQKGGLDFLTGDDLPGIFGAIDKDEGDVKGTLPGGVALSNSAEPRVWKPKLLAGHL
jgi:hypothetical protein